MTDNKIWYIKIGNDTYDVQLFNKYKIINDFIELHETEQWESIMFDVPLDIFCGIVDMPQELHLFNDYDCEQLVNINALIDICLQIDQIIDKIPQNLIGLSPGLLCLEPFSETYLQDVWRLVKSGDIIKYVIILYDYLGNENGTYCAL